VQFSTKYFSGVSIRNTAVSKGKHVADKDKPEELLNKKCIGKASASRQVN